MQDLKELNNRLAKYVDQGLYPGFQWQIIIGDKEFSGKYGFNNIHTKQPVLDNTLYRIWSMTKPIVAVVALKLIEQNKLDELYHLFHCHLGWGNHLNLFLGYH